MSFDLTKHARDALAERKIPVAWVERVLAEPQRVQADRADVQLEHRLGRIAEHDDRVLRVVVKKAVSPLRVVSVYFDRTMRKKL